LKSRIHGDLILKIDLKYPDKISESDFSSIKSLEGVENISLNGKELDVSLNSRKNISRIIEHLGSNILAVNTKEPTLEDVFIKTMSTPKN
jgi:ABC-2 type transport system ATP-binding protein